MTTENLAFLFTDMVDSTALASALTPDAADELRREHFSILRQAVAETRGTEVKNLGDGLMVAFASTSAALACAVAMQQGVESDNRVRPNPIGLRVGLSGGEVTREEADYFGDPVIEAARLCASCVGGQILAADVVRAMAGRRSRHECVPVGPLMLKGLPEPVETVEVRWEPLDSTVVGVPLPGRLALRPAAGVVDRSTDIATILEAFERVSRGGDHEVCLISGEPGVGKSTLVAATARAAFDEGACVLFGHCEEDLSCPYQLFAEALGHYVIHAPEGRLVAHVEGHASELVRLVPSLAGRLPALEPSNATDTDTERYLLFAAVVGFLAQLSRYQPVVLVLDDLQWADQASLQLLRHVISTDQALRVLILGTYRESELSRSHALVETLAGIHSRQVVTRVELDGLDASGVLALMEAVAGHSLDDTAVRLAHALCRETDGNPFFVSEVLRHLAETGAVRQDATGRWVADGFADETVLPDSVRMVISARVGRLGKEAGDILAMAAVIGRDFDLDVLSHATKTSQDDLLDVLDGAAAVALVREAADVQGRYHFVHALIQHTLYEELGPSRRARGHQIVADALEVLYGDRPGSHFGELAHHWSRAPQPANLTNALNASRAAADAALAGLAPGDALRWYLQALDLSAQAPSADPILGIDLTIGLGTAQRQTGDPSFRETLLDAARRAADAGATNRLVRAALANDRGWVSATGVVDAEKVDVLERALERLSPDDPDRALLVAMLCSEVTYGSPLSRREALADEALALAHRSEDDATIVRVLNHVAFPLDVPSLLAQSLARSADAVVRAEKVGDPALLNFAAIWRVVDAGRAGDIAELDRFLAMNGAYAEQLDQPILTWGYVFTCAWRALIAGDTDRAEQLAADALQIGIDSGQPDAELFFGVQVAQVSFLRGSMGDLVPIIEGAIAENPRLSGLHAMLAMAYVEANRLDEARTVLCAFASGDIELSMDPTWLIAMTDFAGAAAECRDVECARQLFDQLIPWADQWSTSGIVMVQGPVAHYLGELATVLGRYDEAEAYFTRAAVSNERANADFFTARTNLSWGKVLAKRDGPGDIDEARRRLDLAREGAVAHGYANVERRALLALEQLS